VTNRQALELAADHLFDRSHFLPSAIVQSVLGEHDPRVDPGLHQ